MLRTEKNDHKIVIFAAHEMVAENCQAIRAALEESMNPRDIKLVILDITGVDVVDTRTADHFIKVVKAAEMLGSNCILTGIQPAVAQTLVEIGVDLSSITTLANLKEGLRECMRRIQDRKKKAAGR